jgi:DNA-binding LacI/PurR family transcriptional regulator
VSVMRHGPTSYESGRVLAQRLLTIHDRPDAVFCVTDLVACGFMDAARQQFSLSVPQDLCIASFDNIEQSGWGSYNLTTFEQPIGKIADAAVEWLESSPDDEPKPLRLYAELIWRGSIRAPLAPTPK